jgi:hypothetical protein
MSLSVFLVHRGDSWYLRNSIAALRRAGYTDIYLLGDDANRHHAGVTHLPLQELRSEQVLRLEARYVHLAVTPPDYERFCFQRWLYLAEAVHRTQPSQVLLIDSDVLMFAGPEQMASFQDAQYYQILRHNPSVVYFTDPKVLDALCAFLLDIYDRPEAELRSHIAARQAKRQYSSQGPAFFDRYPGALHFSDMDMLQEFWEACDGAVGRISRQTPQGSIRHALLPGLANPSPSMLFDSNFASMRGRVFTYDGTRLRVGDGVPVGSLHFQGMSKRYMSLVDAICSAPVRARFVATPEGPFSVEFPSQ